MQGKGLAMIEAALRKMIEVDKRDIGRMVLYVYEDSPLLEVGYVGTKYGCLPVAPNPWAAKGTAYIIEEISKGSGFAWVSKNQQSKEKMNK